MERCTSRLPRQLRRWDDLVFGPGPASVVSSVAVVLLLEALVIGKDVAYVGGANATENSGRNFELMVRFFGWRDDSVCVCVCVCVWAGGFRDYRASYAHGAIDRTTSA